MKGKEDGKGSITGGHKGTQDGAKVARVGRAGARGVTEVRDMLGRVLCMDTEMSHGRRHWRT